MKSLTDTQASYHAGVIDGEGYIGAAKKGNSYNLQVGAYNTKVALLVYLKETSGAGAIYPKNPGNDKHKPSWVWQLYVDEIADYMNQISPFLVIKKEQAILMLEFLTYQKRHTEVNRYNPYSDHELMMRQVIYEELMELNKKGV